MYRWFVSTVGARLHELTTLTIAIRLKLLLHAAKKNALPYCRPNEADRNATRTLSDVQKPLLSHILHHSMRFFLFLSLSLTYSTLQHTYIHYYTYQLYTRLPCAQRTMPMCSSSVVTHVKLFVSVFKREQFVSIRCAIQTELSSMKDSHCMAMYD